MQWLTLKPGRRQAVLQLAMTKRLHACSGVCHASALRICRTCLQSSHNVSRMALSDVRMQKAIPIQDALAAYSSPAAEPVLGRLR